ncbi:MAG: ParA family protein [Planctomycetota bacterium]|nr:ParA family protein [Planctomycetota bacterium]
MAVVAVMSMMGGVGKTTVVMHLGAMFAGYGVGGIGRRVLLIDFDPQAVLSHALLSDKAYLARVKADRTCLAVLQEQRPGVASANPKKGAGLMPPSVKTVAVHLGKGRHVFDLVPSTLDLINFNEQPITRQKMAVQRFQRFIAECRAQYDLIFIDCHPGRSCLSWMAVLNADHIVIPSIPEEYTALSIRPMMKFIAMLPARRRSPRVHILFNKVRQNRPSPGEAAIRETTGFRGCCMTQTLRKDNALASPHYAQRPVRAIPTSKTGRAIRKWVQVGEELGCGDSGGVE